MTYYDTQEEADKALEMLPRLAGVAFCPLIKNDCRSDCICYEEGKVTLRRVWNKELVLTEDKFTLIEARCNHALICGYIETAS